MFIPASWPRPAPNIRPDLCRTRRACSPSGSWNTHASGSLRTNTLHTADWTEPCLLNVQRPSVQIVFAHDLDGFLHKLFIFELNHAERKEPRSETNSRSVLITENYSRGFDLQLITWKNINNINNHFYLNTWCCSQTPPQKKNFIVLINLYLLRVLNITYLNLISNAWKIINNFLQFIYLFISQMITF